VGALPTAFAVALMILVAWSMVTALPTIAAPREATVTGFRAAAALVRAGPRLPLILAAALLVTTGVSAILTFVPLRIGGLGGTPFLVGVAAGLAAVIEIPTLVLSGRIIRALGLRGTFALGALVYAAAFALLSAASSPGASWSLYPRTRSGSLWSTSGWSSPWILWWSPPSGPRDRVSGMP
jgi:hypothetical protein